MELMKLQNLWQGQTDVTATINIPNTEWTFQQNFQVVVSDQIPPVVNNSDTHTFSVSFSDDRKARIYFGTATGTTVENETAIRTEIVIDPVSARDMTVPIRMEGTAILGTDYRMRFSPEGVTLSETNDLSIPAGIRTVTVSFMPIDNDDDALDKIALLRLGAGTGYVLNQNSSFTLTISNDDELITGADFSVTDIQVQPNPSSNYLYLSWTDTNAGRKENIPLVVTDLSGRNVISQTVTFINGIYVLPVQQLHSGIYVLTLVRENHARMLRFIKQ